MGFESFQSCSLLLHLFFARLNVRIARVLLLRERPAGGGDGEAARHKGPQEVLLIVVDGVLFVKPAEKGQRRLDGVQLEERMKKRKGRIRRIEERRGAWGVWTGVCVWRGIETRRVREKREGEEDE